MQYRLRLAPPVAPVALASIVAGTGRTLNFSATLIATLAVALCVSARADQVCGAAEEQYTLKLASGLQPFASSVTKTGMFSVKDEHPGNGRTQHVITFTDHGKTIFVHRVSDGVETTSTLRPGKSKTGEPGIGISLAQGSLGSCEYAVIFREGKFVAVSRGQKQGSAITAGAKGDAHHCPKGYSWQETSGGPGRPNYMSCLRNVGPNE